MSYDVCWISSTMGFYIDEDGELFFVRKTDGSTPKTADEVQK